MQEVWSDFLGKKLPLSSRGNSWLLCIETSPGHRVLKPMRSKEADAIERAGVAVMRACGLAEAPLRWYMDSENTAKLNEKIVESSVFFDDNWAVSFAKVGEKGNTQIQENR